MKVILYVLAIVVIIGTAVLSFNNQTKFEEQVMLTRSLEADNVHLAASISKSQTELAGLKADVASTRSEIDVKVAELERLLVAFKASTAEGVELDGKLVSLKGQLDQLEASLKEVAEILGGANVQIDTLPDELKKVADTLEGARIAKEALLKKVSEVETAVAANQDEAGRLQGRVSTRAIAISRNSLQSVITGVNNEWGFAVVGAGAGAGVTGETRFLVQRGGHTIARLVPTAVEAGQTVTDIDPKSINRGVTLRAGDAVILEKVTE
jgi:hypothetical protein